MLVDIKKLEHFGDLPLPSYATLGSAGLDLIAAISESDTVFLAPMERKLIPTGLCIALQQNFEAQIRPRSGLAAKHGVTVTNAPGTIDSDYRGEIFVSLINLGNESFEITRGMRIAQIVITKFERINWNLVQKLEDSDRNHGGFGSTGV